MAAVDTRTSKRYAIKTLLGGAKDVSQRALLDEAAVVVQLSHPNIVSLVDVGRDASGALFLVMDLVDGTSLRDWLGKWPDVADVFRAFDQILDALSAAHAQGVVHGDLKPANVLVERDGRGQDHRLRHRARPRSGAADVKHVPSEARRCTWRPSSSSSRTTSVRRPISTPSA